MNSLFYQTVLLGSVVCVVSAAATEHAKRQEKQPSSDQAGLNRVWSERKFIRGIIAESMKGALRFTAFTASILYLSQTIAAYRNKSSVWEYTVASTLGFGIMEVDQGVKRCAKLAFRGAVFGTLGGYVVCQFLASYGMNQEQKHLECVRHHLQEQNLTQHMTQSSEDHSSLS